MKHLGAIIIFLISGFSQFGLFWLVYEYQLSKMYIFMGYFLIMGICGVMYYMIWRNHDTEM